MRFSRSGPNVPLGKPSRRYDAEPAATYKFKPRLAETVRRHSRFARARAKDGRKGHGVLLRFLNQDVPEQNRRSFLTSSLSVAKVPTNGQNCRPVLLVVKASKPTTASAGSVKLDVTVRLQAVALPEADGGFTVVIPALGCATQGDTIEEAQTNAVEAAEGWLTSQNKRIKDEAIRATQG